MLGACDLSVVARGWPRPSRLLQSCRAQAHSGSTGPGAPAHGQVDVDGHVQQRQTVAARAASERPDRVLIRSYRLRAILGLGGGGKARGVSGLNGESSTLWGLLGTHVQAPGHSAGGRGRSQAGSNCPSPGRGRTLRSRRSLAGVCCAPGPQRRRGGLHCDPGLCVLTSHSLFLAGILGSPGAFRHLVKARA